MFPTGLSSPNPPPPPTQEARTAATDVKGDSGNITSPKKRKINGSEREDTADPVPPSPSKSLTSSASSSSSSSSTSGTPLHIHKKLRFDDSVDLIGLDVKMAEDAAAAATCSHNKSKAVFLSAGVGHHANGLTKTAGSATFSNSKPGAAKKLVIKNFKGSTQTPGWVIQRVNRRLKVKHNC